MEYIYLSEENEIEEFKRKFKKFPDGPLSMKQVEEFAKLYRKALDLDDEKMSDDELDEFFELLHDMDQYAIGINDWLDIDTLEVKKILTKELGPNTTREITADWSIGKDSAKKEIDRIRKSSTKLPKKKLKLESLLEEKDLSKMTAGEIYNAGKNWKQFDFNKGFEELIKKDKDGYWIHLAGEKWKEFDFNKGFNELIKKDKTGEWIYSSGVYWKYFNYEKGIELVKNTVYYDYALEDWPIGIKDVKQITKQIKDTATKLPKKKLKLEDTLNEEEINIEYLKKKANELKKIFNKGIKEGYSKELLKELFSKQHELDQYIWNNNFKFYNTEEAQKYFNKLEVLLVDVYKWPNFNRTEAEKIVKDVLKKYPGYGDILISSWPMNIKDVKEKTQNIKKSSTKLPKKKLKLEDTLNEQDMSQKDLKKLVKKKIPEAKIQTPIHSNHILFKYKNINFGLSEKDGQIATWLEYIPSEPHKRTYYMDVWSKVEQLLTTPTKEEAIEKTKEIKKTATKLPKKKLKLEDAIKEEWLDTVKVVGEPVDIFVNPVSSDIKSLKKSGVKDVRFLIDLNEKKIYVWDGDVPHKDISEKINKPYKPKGTKGYFWGAGIFRGNKIKLFDVSIDRTRTKDKIDVVKEKMYTDWLSKYFTNL